MAVPGLGTTVRYHYSADFDVPGIVVGTGDHWNTALTTFYGIADPATPPTSSQVYLVVFLSDGGSPGMNYYAASEGTSVGQFSLLTTEAEDV